MPPICIHKRCEILTRRRWLTHPPTQFTLPVGRVPKYTIDKEESFLFLEGIVRGDVPFVQSLVASATQSAPTGFVHQS